MDVPAGETLPITKLLGPSRSVPLVRMSRYGSTSLPARAVWKYTVRQWSASTALRPSSKREGTGRPAGYDLVGVGNGSPPTDVPMQDLGVRPHHGWVLPPRYFGR